MKKPLLRLVFALLMTGVSTMIHAEATANEAATPVAIAIHGGAGTIEKGRFSPGEEESIRETLELAARAGYQILTSGGSSLDAVTKTITILEDSPHFNAGKGAVFNYEGVNELDASIMEGARLDAGAVAAVRNIRNPILLAREVMTVSPHVMLMGAGAQEFAKENGIAFADDDWFYTEYRWNQLQEKKAREKGAGARSPEKNNAWYSTVGAVALDARGDLAAGTSTGGMTNKRWGRVGDSPIIGAGTYADNRSCAVSATGHGEFFIRATVARDICARVQYTGVSLQKAAQQIVNVELPEMGGDGGVIAIDRRGNIALVFNTTGMYRASVGTDGQLEVAIFDDE